MTRQKSTLLLAAVLALVWRRQLTPSSLSMAWGWWRKTCGSACRPTGRAGPAHGSAADVSAAADVGAAYVGTAHGATPQAPRMAPPQRWPRRT